MLKTRREAVAEKQRSTIVTQYIDIDDDPVTEWGPGATKFPEEVEWESADARIGFTDLGYSDGHYRAQIVAYGQRHRNLSNVAVSVELSPEEARQIAERLLTFANWATQPPVAVDADGEVIPEDDARHPDFD